MYRDKLHEELKKQLSNPQITVPNFHTPLKCWLVLSQPSPEEHSASGTRPALKRWDPFMALSQPSQGEQIYSSAPWNYLPAFPRTAQVGLYLVRSSFKNICRVVDGFCP